MKKLVLLSIPVVFSIAIYGCGQGSSTTGSSSNQSGSTSVTQPAKTAVVTFKANFPKKGEASKSLIDPNTASIEVHYRSLGGVQNEGSVTLTPDNPTATVNLLPIKYQITAYAKDKDGNILEVAGSSGQLSIGTNTVVITFLNGKWTFVDSNDNAEPITLSDGLQLDGFLLGNLYYQATSKAAFDNTKPMYFAQYRFIWASGDNLSRNSYLNHTTQFLGGDVNNSSVDGGFYNLTKNCDDCDTEVGDRGIGILGDLMVGGYSEGAHSLLPPSEFNPDITQYGNSKVLDGTHITGTLVEFTVAGRGTPEVIFAGTTAKALTSQPGSRTEALKKALSGVKKSRTNPTCLPSLTNSWYDPVIVCTDKNGNGQIDYGDWRLGTKYTDKNGVEYYEWGYLYSENGTTTNPGECSWGLEPTDQNNLGEWEDYNKNGIAEPWEFYDKNGDGTIDFGSFRFTHYLKATETFRNVCAYPFRAKGEPIQMNTNIQVR